MGMPALFVPVGDPQSNRDPRLKPGGCWGHRPLPWGYTSLQGLPRLGGCLRRKWDLVRYPVFPLISSSFGICIIRQPQDLRNVPLLGSEVFEE